MREKVVIFWFRRDLRLNDNVGLSYALASGFPVIPIFIFDKEILETLPNSYDRRVDYIHQSLDNINHQLGLIGSTLYTFFDKAVPVFHRLLKEYDIQEVYCNRDYEPKAIKRDTEVFDLLRSSNVLLKAYKDQVIFDKNDILKSDGKPYTVFSPYAKRWKEKLADDMLEPQSLKLANFHQHALIPIHSLKSIGFEKTDMDFAAPKLDLALIADYDKYRDFPALEKTTELGIALRFGTISIRECVITALQYNQVWLSELIWREFFMQILYHFPHVEHSAFKPKYDTIQWRNNEREFELWCKGETGYPIVDAGMRQLNATGFMHNRVRMIVASFLCKHLLIDWRWGEAYFAEKLNDYDLSANNGNWQWAASSGCDAVPYFRIFNPSLQSLKFDKDSSYIKKWLGNFDEGFHTPIVDHVYARERALRVYANALK